MMRGTISLTSLLLCALLGACREQRPAATPAAPAASASATATAPPVSEAVPAAPELTPEQREADAAGMRERVVLMQAIFGGKFNPVHNAATMRLSVPEEPGMHVYTIEPVAHTILPNGDAALVANALRGERGPDDNRVRAEGGLLNIFILRKTNGRWALLKHHPNIARMGSWETIGRARFMQLAPGKPGLAMLHGFAMMDYAQRKLSLFDLTADPVRSLTGDGITIFFSTSGCVPEEENICSDIVAGWRFALPAAQADYNDLVLTFVGQDDGKKEARRKGQEGPVLASDITSLNGTARYAYNGKTYVLVEGKNPGPEE
ncbi:hypothetical protein INH39_10090 [Massilia violaceinigra]|uniref:Lipoprotein n=1 Tax=Massilia violaceinigra TaxID=2045208 RepID=A0ABY4AB16_9BURK|nr:hypothetical protein [Massilia violaceinigra]UOD31982.1 hypothetical protein INH39_10090 [Massilia violaceinigra]